MAHSSVLQIMSNPTYNKQMLEMTQLMATKPGELAKATQGLSHEDVKHSSDKKSPDELIVEQLNRCLKERKPVSNFSESYTIEHMTEITIKNNIADLILWKNGDFRKGTKDGCFRMESQDMFRTVGTGIRWVADKEGNEHLQHVETKQAAIILTKNMGTLNDFGFTRKTAYPNIMTSEAQPTGIDLTKYIEKTDVYKTATPEEQAWMLKVTELPKSNNACKAIKQTELKGSPDKTEKAETTPEKPKYQKGKSGKDNHKNSHYQKGKHGSPGKRYSRDIPDKDRYLNMEVSIGEQDRIEIDSY
jgi:hypothetical protein